MKKKWTALLTGAALLLLLGTVLYGYTSQSSQTTERYRISVIVYGSNDDRWTFMREGINQAAKDLGAEISFVNMATEDDVTEQTELLQREIENGAQGILLAVADSQGMYEAVNASAKKIPILMIETGLEFSENSLGTLAADDYGMGCLLAEMVSRHDGKIAVVAEYGQRNSVARRLQGFLETLPEDADAVLWQRGEGDYDLSLFIGKMCRMEGLGRTIVTLDDIALEAAVDALSDVRETGTEDNTSFEKPDLYGIGATDKIVYHLDKGDIDGIVFQNEFSIGYLGVEQMVKKLQQNLETGALEQISIGYYEATRENMYDAKIQGLLFPIVQ